MIRTPRIHEWDRYCADQRERIRTKLKNRVKVFRARSARAQRDANENAELAMEMRGQPQASDPGRDAELQRAAISNAV